MPEHAWLNMGFRSKMSQATLCSCHGRMLALPRAGWDEALLSPGWILEGGWEVDGMPKSRCFRDRCSNAGALIVGYKRGFGVFYSVPSVL